GDSVEALSGNKKLRAAALKEIQGVGKLGGLAGIEIIDGLVLAREEWTPQNGLVTSAMKVNRKAILQKYKGEIDAVLAN
ncbi:MAG: hypothetical protein Q9180_009487, partial [Flavoplaca navasiana]